MKSEQAAIRERGDIYNIFSLKDLKTLLKWDPLEKLAKFTTISYA